MNFIFIGSLLVLFLLYIIAIVVYIDKRITLKKIETNIETNVAMAGITETSSTKDRVSTVKTFAFEDFILKRMGIKPSQAIAFLYISRVIIVLSMAVLLFFLRGLAFAAVSAVIIVIFFDDLYKKAIYNAGVLNIPRITNFVNFFTPHINSGDSADQALLKYIEVNADEELSEFYKNKENPDYKMPEHLRQIVDIYDIAVYNEKQGISDYTYIFNELAEDYDTKSGYYNKFLGAMGEIKPTQWAYYIAPPILTMLSFSMAKDFWTGLWGWVTSLGIVILFLAFNFLIFKLKEKTIHKIF